MFALGNDQFDMRTLLRLTAWGTGAALALALAVTSGMSATGSRRASVALASWGGGDSSEPQRQVTAAQLVPRTSDLDGETRRLNEAIRLLAADRDRLATRVGSLERNVDDMTGSIRQSAGARTPGNAAASPLPQISSLQSPSPGAAPETASPATFPTTAAHAPPAAAATWPTSTSAAWPSPSAAVPIAPSSPPLSRVATAPPGTAATGDIVRTAPGATKTEFGVDIGAGDDMESLRAIWNGLKTQHGSLINGLRPVYSVIDNRSGQPEMRLIIGPIANAAAAAKLCATLGAADVLCSTRQFVGQRLPVQ
jgi:hypothetical protein